MTLQDLDFAALDALEQQAVVNQSRVSAPTGYLETEKAYRSNKGSSGGQFVSKMPEPYFSGDTTKSRSQGLWGHIFEGGDKLKSMYLKPLHCSISDKTNNISKELEGRLHPGPSIAHNGCRVDKYGKEDSHHRNCSSSVQACPVTSFEDSKATRNWIPTKQPVWRPKTGCLWEDNNDIDRGVTYTHGSMKSMPDNIRETGSVNGDSNIGMQHKVFETIESAACSLDKAPGLENKNTNLESSSKNDVGKSTSPIAESSKKQEVINKVDIYINNNVVANDLWYYEPRRTISSHMEQDLAACNTTSGGLQVCRNAARYWAYPNHVPERKYQIMAISKALLSNTLICFPTGLGKTLVAAVVMNNFVRWFPKVSRVCL